MWVAFDLFTEGSLNTSLILLSSFQNPECTHFTYFGQCGILLCQIKANKTRKKRREVEEKYYFVKYLFNS